MENSRHTVVKRKVIGLKTLILFNKVKSMAAHAGIKHGTSEVVSGKEC